MTQAKPTAEPSEAVRAFMAPAPSEVFTFKRWESGPTGAVCKEEKVRVKLLRLTETHAVLAAAQRYAKDLGEIPGEHRDIYREAQAVELAWRALVRVDEREKPDGTRYYQPIFASSEHLRSSFSEPEIAQVLNMYEIVKSKYGEIEAFSEEELDLWTQRLSEPLLGEYFLSRLDSNHWARLMLWSAREVKSLREEVGRPLSNLDDTSESDPTSSDTGIGSFTELPEAHSNEQDESLPVDKLLTRSEALDRGKRMRKRKQ